MYSIYKDARILLFAIVLVLSLIFCTWNVLKLCWMYGDSQNDQPSQNEEDLVMSNLVRVHNLQNTLHEYESADAPEI